MRTMYETVQEAVNQIAEKMRSKTIRFSVYGSDIDVKKNCVVNKYMLKPVETDTKYEVCWSNIKVTIEYTAPSLDIVGKAIPITKTIKLYFLCPRGDDAIPEPVLEKIWVNSRKPDTVAVDSENGDVYCVYLEDDGILFEYFGTLSVVYKDLVSDNLNCERPYEFGVHKNALYDFIVGEEGWKHIRSNLYIQFNNANGVKLSQSKEEH